MLLMSLLIVPENHTATHDQEKLYPANRLSKDYLTGNKTGCIYSMAAQNLEYNDEYFLQEYKAQYGKTYIEDEFNLRKSFKNRLDIIQYHKPAPASLLEIGCATGFFLDEAQKAGYQTTGCELSRFASDYGKNQYGLDILNVSYLDFPDLKYDIIVACFVIEHFPNQPEIFSKISNQLQNNGLLLFSIPSTNGPLMEFDPVQWMSTHPKDHFADYGPASIRKTLDLYNLELKKAWPASYHQSRTRGWKKWLSRRCYQKYANKFCYADTIIGIAIKKTHGNHTTKNTYR